MINDMRKIFKWLFNKRKHNQPFYIRGVWYNRSVHSRTDKYPKVFDEQKKYINAKIGLIVLMNELPNGDKVFYRIIEIRYLRGSDWLYDSDNIECDLKFSHIESSNQLKQK